MLVLQPRIQALHTQAHARTKGMSQPTGTGTKIHVPKAHLFDTSTLVYTDVYKPFLCLSVTCI